MTVEQLNEIIEGRVSEQTFFALQVWAKSEKRRRTAAGNMGGKPRKYEGDLKERNKAAAAKYRERKKSLQNKDK